MSDSIKVRKRNGRGIEPLNLEKMHKMVEEATTGLAGVSASQVEINSGIQFYDGITTDEIQSILIRSASDLISLDNPNYQYVAARLLLFGLRKNLHEPKCTNELNNTHCHQFGHKKSICFAKKGKICMK